MAKITQVDYDPFADESNDGYKLTEVDFDPFSEEKNKKENELNQPGFIDSAKSLAKTIVAKGLSLDFEDKPTVADRAAALSKENQNKPAPGNLAPMSRAGYESVANQVNRDGGQAQTGVLGQFGYGKRTDGTEKGAGYFGELKRPDGGISTELSVGVNIGGKDMDIPTLVPTLDQQEIDYLLAGNKPTDAIVQKAVDHARTRLSDGKSPFADASDLGVIERAKLAAKDDQALQSRLTVGNEALDKAEAAAQIQREKSVADQNKLEAQYQDEQNQGAVDSALTFGKDAAIGLTAGTLRLPGQISGIAEALPIVGSIVTDTKNALASSLPGWANPTEVADYMSENLVSATTRRAQRQATERATAAAREAAANGEGDLGQIWANAKGAASGMIDNPRAMLPLIAENAPQLFAIAKVVELAIAKDAVAMDAAVKAGTMTEAEAQAALQKLAIKYSSAGEGLITAGQIEQGILKDNPDATMLERAAAVPAGFITALISRGASSIPGFTDAPAALAMAKLGKPTGYSGSVLAQVGKGIVGEGVLQEFPQSAQEQAWKNLGSRKPWQEGVGEQAVQGAVAGAAMGGGAALAGGRSLNPLEQSGSELADGISGARFNPNNINDAAIAALDPNGVRMVDGRAYRKPGTPLTNAAVAAGGITPNNIPDGAIPAADILGTVEPESPLTRAATVAGGITEQAQHTGTAATSPVQNVAPTVSTQPQEDRYGQVQGQEAAQEIAALQGKVFTDDNEAMARSERLDSLGIQHKIAPSPDGHGYVFTFGGVDGTANQTANSGMVGANGGSGTTNGAAGGTTGDIRGNGGAVPAGLDVAGQPEPGTGQAGSAPDANVGNAALDNRSAVVLQNRDRSTPESIKQMRGIAANPVYGRMSFARDAANGAPVVFDTPPANIAYGRTDSVYTANGRKLPVKYAVVDAADIVASHDVQGNKNAVYTDGTNALRVIGGNGRIAGIQEAYRLGNTDQYVSDLVNDADMHKIAPEAIAQFKHPVLVRVMDNADITPNIGDELNGRTNMELSVLEQAKTDARRLRLEALDFNEDGSLTTAAVKSFVLAMPENERAGLMDNGQPGQRAVDRVMAAMFHQAYGDDELVRLYSQATDQEAKTIINALGAAAPAMARLQGAGNDFDIRSIVADAGKLAVNATRRGEKLATIAKQDDIEISPEARGLLGLMADNIRAPRKLAELLNQIANNAYEESNKPDSDMLGAVPKRSVDEIVRRATNANEPGAAQSNGNGRGGRSTDGAGRATSDDAGEQGAPAKSEKPVQAGETKQPAAKPVNEAALWWKGLSKEARVAAIQKTGLNIKPVAVWNLISSPDKAAILAARDVAPQAPVLTSYTNQDILNRENEQSAQDQARAEEESAARAAQAKRDEEDAKARRATYVGNADNFQFGESSADAAKPEGDIFSQPATTSTSTTPPTSATKPESSTAQAGAATTGAPEPANDLNPYERFVTGETVDIKKLSDPAYFVKAYKSTFAPGGTDEVLYKKLIKQLVPKGREPSTYLANLYNKAKQEVAAQTADQFAGNTVFTADKVAAARERMKKKLGTLNSGFDPEFMNDGITIAGAYIESGVRSFADYSRAMIKDFGEAIRPYLRSFYEGIRYNPDIDTKGMTPAAEIDAKAEKVTPQESDNPAVGKVEERPKRTGIAAVSGIKLKDNYGVDSINGYDNETGEGASGPIKSQFLKDTKKYLSEVSKALENSGFVPHTDRKGKPTKPVSVNESGIAGSGDVSLTMFNPELNRGIYITIGGSSLRGVVPTTKSGIAVMMRTTELKDRFGGDQNRWMPVDLTSAELAAAAVKAVAEAANVQKAVQDKRDAAKAAGKQAFHEGKPRNVPIEFVTDKEAARLWSQGWDIANVEAPVPGVFNENEVIESDGESAQNINQGAQNARPVQTDGISRDNSQPGPQGRTGSDRAGESLDVGMAQDGEGADLGAGIRGGVSASTEPGTGTAGERNGIQSPEQDGTVRTVRTEPATPSDDLNYTIDDADNLGSGGLAAKFRDNVAAIKILKALDAEERTATPEERKALARYVGFGALKGAFDPENKTWAKQYAELRELLTDEEFESARASTLNAHYTSPAVVKFMFNVADRLGFHGGRVLEPAMGSGNFFGLMPAAMRNASKLHGVELDLLTSKLAKALYPKANVAVATGFQDYQVPAGFFDMAIGNPPFGSESVPTTERTAYARFSIHNYFIARMVDKVREGGIVPVIVSHNFMDAINPQARQWVAERANLIGAVRLPNTTFKQNAGTEVVTDILFFQKTATPEKNPVWVRASDVMMGEERVSINTYFQNNKQNILGTETTTGSMWRANEYTVVPRKDGKLENHLADFLNTLPENIYTPIERTTDELDSVDNTIPDGVKAGSYFVNSNGEIRQRGNDIAGSRTSVVWKPKNATAEQRMLGMIRLRDTLRAQMRMERDAAAAPADIDRHRLILNKMYDEFYKKYGFVNSQVNRSIFIDDTESALLQSIEFDYDKGVSKAVAEKNDMDERAPSAKKADILSRRVLFPLVEKMNVQTAKDALLASLDSKGGVDLDYMERAYGKPRDAIISELGNLIYLDPVGGEYVMSDEYLSGDVKTKLAEAQKAADENPAYNRNVNALKEVIPGDKLPSEIFASLGSAWIPADVFKSFAEEITGSKDIDLSYLAATAHWVGRLNGGGDIGMIESDYGTPKYGSFDLLIAHLNGKAVEVKKRIQRDGKDAYVTDEEATEAAKEKAAKIKQKWESWVWADGERADKLASIFNERFNRTVSRKYDGSHLVLHGTNPAMKLRAHQKDGVWRIVQDRNALLDHVVGAGKTFAMVAAAMEMKRLGIARKPLFVVPNHLTIQWRSEFSRLYPSSNVLAATPDDFSKGNRERMFSKIALGDYDAVIIGHSSLTKIGMDPEFEVKMLQEQIDEIADAIEAIKRERGDRGIVGDMEKIKKNLEAKLQKLKAKGGQKDNVVTFEELGVDALFVDEMHEFKNLFFVTQKQRVSGLGNPEGSGKAFDLFGKIRWLQKTYGEKAPLITATGTPVSNSLAEMYTMQRYMRYDELKRDGLHLFDSWARMYGEDEYVYEVAPSGVGYRISQRFSKFKNLPSLMASYNKFADTVTMQDLKDQSVSEGKRFPVPNVTGGRPQNIVAQRSTMQRDFFGIPQIKRDPDGNIVYGINLSSVKIEQNVDSKWVLSDGRSSSVHETREDAELSLVQKALSPELVLDDDTLLGQFANLKELTRATEGKINALSLTSLANKAGLDIRLIYPDAPDFADSKINQAIANMLRIYKQWNADKGAQLVFCDLSIPLSARAALGSKERRLYVLDDDGALTHKKGTLHAADGFDGFPFYLVKSGKKGNTEVAIYDPITGRQIKGGFANRNEAKAWVTVFLTKDENRSAWYDMRDKYEAISPEQIDEYREQNELEVAEDGSNEVSMDDLESISGASGFSVYDDIKGKLIAGGIPEKEIAFIHDYDTPKKKQDLFARVNRGEVRFLFGSTPKLGAGTNVQERLVALHHIDAPWRPSDLEQREGRIIRQGNALYMRDPEGFEVFIGRYATEQTYDTRRWQILEHKASGIEQLRNYSGEAEIEDVAGEAANAADMKAAASGNPLILEETKLRTEVKRLTAQLRGHSDALYSMQQRLKHERNRAAYFLPDRLAILNADMDAAKAHPARLGKDTVGSLVINGKSISGRQAAEKAIHDMAEKVRKSPEINASSTIVYRGIKFEFQASDFRNEKGVAASYIVAPTGSYGGNYDPNNPISASGMLTRFENYIDSLDQRKAQVEAEIEEAKKAVASLETRINTPFEGAAALEAAKRDHGIVQRKLMKSTQVEAIPEEQMEEFEKDQAARKKKLQDLGYGDALREYNMDGAASNESAVSEPDQRYNVEKDVLLGGGRVSETERGANNNNAGGGTENVYAAPALSVREAANVPGLYHVTSQLISSGERAFPLERVKTLDDAAKATAYLSRYAVEHYDAIVTDADGKPLAIIGAFKGAIGQASVYPSTVLQELAKIEGAAHLYASHNHPSGTTELSSFDRDLNDVFENILDGSGVTYHGLIAVAGDKYGATDGSSGSTVISGDARGIQVPIVERMVTGTPDGATIRNEVDSKDIVPKIAGKTPGIVFLSYQHAPVAFVPFAANEMAPLRQDGRLMKLLRAAAGTNAAAAIIANPGNTISEAEYNNLAAALSKIDIRTLDVITYGDGSGRVIGATAQGTLHPGRIFFSRSSIGLTHGGMNIRDLRALVSRIEKSYKNMPDVVVLESPESLDLTDAEQQRLYDYIVRNDAIKDVEGATHEGKIYLFASGMANEFRAEFVMAQHEITHVGLRAVYGTEADAVLQTIWMNNQNVRAMATEVKVARKITSNIEATEEVLADMETADLVKLKGWRKLVQMVRNWFERHGFAAMAKRLDTLLKAGMTEQQQADLLVADVVHAAREWVKSGKAGQLGHVADTRLSRAQDDLIGQPPAQTQRQNNLPLQGGQTGNSASWDAPEPSFFDDLVYKLQDKNIDLKRVLQAIRDTGAQVAEKWDTYLQEELFHGRSAKRVHDFVNTELKPMLVEMQARGVKQEEIDAYLHARHAKEANALIASRDPNMPDGGSGMSNKQADDYLANLPADKLKQLEVIAKRVDAIIAKTREYYVSYGLVSRDQVDSWMKMFEHYVPLMREDHDGYMGIGQGFSIKGKEVKHRTGSTAKVVDILANIAMQREKAIVRGEKNRVTVSLLGLAKLNPNPDFWTFGPPAPERRYNESTKQVEYFINGNWKNGKYVVVGKIKDDNGQIHERAVIFNEHDERAVRMVEAMNNLDASQLNGALALSAKITRYFSAINTQYNPIFGVTNLVRDTGGMALNLSSTPLAGRRLEVLNHIPSALAGIYLDARAERKGHPATSQWAQMWEELQDSGGMTGYRDLYRDSADRAKSIEHELDPHNWVNSKWGKVFTAGGMLKVPLTTAQDIASPLFDWLSDYNLMMEGATRLAIYKTAIDNELTKQQAASLAKNTTVNFNRKGQSGQQAGALYAFFNAAMQGTARIGETVFNMDKGDIKTLRLSKAGKVIVSGGVMLGVMQALALAAAGFDDDEPPEFIRERNLIIPIGGKKYISIPMPLGYHVIPNLGRIPTEFVLRGMRHPAERVINLMGIFAEAFNPMGNAGMSLQTVLPTPFDPFTALAENKDWTGKTIYKEDFNSMKPTPGFTRNKDTASVWSKFMAESINYATGGTDYTPGIFSPTADQIDYLIGQVTGGVGREISKGFQTGSALISGEDLPTHKVPLVGRFYGNLDDQSSQGAKYYSNLKEINMIDAEIKGRRKDHLPTDEFRKENPKAQLIGRAKHADKIIANLRKQKRELIEKNAPREKIRSIEDKITAEMLRFNTAVDKLE